MTVVKIKKRAKRCVMKRKIKFKIYKNSTQIVKKNKLCRKQVKVAWGVLKIKKNS